MTNFLINIILENSALDKDFTQLELSASTYAGLESVLAEELRKLGAADVKERTRLVSFKGDMGFVFKANLGLRTALRVYHQIKRFQFNDKQHIYDTVKSIEWDQWLRSNGNFYIHSNSDGLAFNNSMYLAQLTKDAIADFFKEKYKERPSINKEQADVQINIHVNKDYCTISLDTSGESLHKRGYRIEQVEAPMSEVLAAGIIKISNWSHHFPVYDFMCGSGTFSIEAALLALNIPPGYFRKRFAFQGWRNYDEKLFEQIAESLSKKIIDIPLTIKAADKYAQNVELAQENIKEAGLEQFIKVETKDFFHQRHSGQKAFLFINPPYNERLPLEDAVGFHKSIGDALKTNFKGCEAWIITGNLDAAKHIGLRPHRKIDLFNGPIPSKLLAFQMYEGTKKIHKLENKEEEN